LVGFALSVVGFPLIIAAVNRRRGLAVKEPMDGPARGESTTVNERR
jgi:hypothetical protein